MMPHQPVMGSLTKGSLINLLNFLPLKETPMKQISQFLWYRLADPRLQLFFKLLLGIGLLGFCLNALADGNDLLQGTDASWWATFNGTGKVYLYTGEAILAIALFIKSRNMVAFIGIVALAVFIDVYLHMAGQTA
jgi:hypothetical protein